MAEKGKERYWDAQQRRYMTRDTLNYGRAGKSIGSAVEEQKSSIAAAAARLAKPQQSPMPKQTEGESPAAYAERLRVWREQQKEK